jgi:ATPase subunit of ABC transporter with duplicated ATPase domains
MGSFAARLYLARYGEELCAALISGTAGPEAPAGITRILARAIGEVKGYHHRSKLLTALAFGSYNRRFEKERENLTEMPTFEEAMFLGMDEDIALPAGKTVLDVTLPQLCVQGKTLAEDIRLYISGPEKLCIIGRNGTGKSTFLKELHRILQERSDITVGYMPQNYEELLDMDKTPVEFLAPRGDKETVTHVRTCLGSMKYTHEEMLHPIRGLSGGQKAKLLLLKLKLSRADVLLLDEPTRNFSPLSGPVVRQLISSFGGAVISVSHDRKYMEEVCTRVLQLTPQGLVPIYDMHTEE